jgi:hypothetical protein
MANCRRLYTTLADEHGVTLWILRKERPDSPNKIDGGMAAVLSWAAKNDALADGATARGGWDFAGFDLDAK